MSLWLLSQSLLPLCRPSTVEVQRWSKEAVAVTSDCNRLGLLLRV